MDSLYKRYDVVCHLVISSGGTCFVGKSSNNFKLSSTGLVKEAFNKVTVYDSLRLSKSLDSWFQCLRYWRRHPLVEVGGAFSCSEMRSATEHSVEIDLLIHGLVKLVKNSMHYLRNLEKHTNTSRHCSVEEPDSERSGNVSLSHFTKGLHFLQSFSSNPPGRDEVLSDHECIIGHGVINNLHCNIFLINYLCLFGLLSLLLRQ